MKRTKAIREGVVELNFPKVEHELKKQHATPELPSELLTIVEQTGCLLIRRPDRAREEKRNQFIASLRQWLSHIRKEDACDRLDRHCRQVELCQQAFREIYSSLEACPVGRVSPAIFRVGRYLRNSNRYGKVVASRHSKPAAFDCA
jgi:hypothetical protein